MRRRCGVPLRAHVAHPLLPPSLLPCASPLLLLLQHAWPESIKTVWQILVNDLGVVVNPNTNGALPYPYKPQGLLSIQQID